MTKEVELIDKIAINIEKVILGKKPQIYNILKGVLANGHILIEDVPGVGKTTLIKALSKSLNLSNNRIQFTPDLLPSDILGVSIYSQKTNEFEFKKGPIFSN
ncbi:MAG: AAA family ATPase, partial [Clostridiaceae bacterium]|nr:AAA family ATPase [Clostridiaceae bacterium]